jgi:high frequency lysogenization protein
MREPFEEQVMALAGVAQVARLVEQISKTGDYPAEFFNPIINSLFVFDPQSTEEVYGGVSHLKLGLHNLANILASRDSAGDQDTVRYLFGILHLERKFAADTAMAEIVRSRLEHTQFKSDHFSSHVHEVCHSLSGIYQDTLSTFKFRIKVTGSMQQLQNETNADLIRALLLAGIRSAWLWRQLGGARWKLAVQRRKMLRAAQNLSRALDVV